MEPVPRNVYFDVLDDIVDKYNNTYHDTIKMLTLILMLNAKLILMKKILSLKLVLMWEFQNIKIFLLRDMLLISQKNFFLLAKLKIQFEWFMPLVI